MLSWGGDITAGETIVSAMKEIFPCDEWLEETRSIKRVFMVAFKFPLALTTHLTFFNYLVLA